MAYLKQYLIFYIMLKNVGLLPEQWGKKKYQSTFFLKKDHGGQKSNI